MWKRRKVKSLSHAQLFVTPWTVALPCSSVHGISQARILEWVAISSSRRSSRPSDWTRVSCIVGRHFTIWATGKSYECESWTIKKPEHWRNGASELWCWMEETLESPVDCKENEPVNLKGDKPWVFIGRTDAEAPILRSPLQRADSLEKTILMGEIWRQEEKAATGDEMAG